MQVIFGTVLGAVAMLATAEVALAEADGPDFFRVIGVDANDVLNIRTDASASSDKVGTIPPDGDGIRNLGCKGGMSYAEWSEASESEREAAKKRRWCQVSYVGIQGWVAGRFLGEGSAPAKGTTGPSFDCTKASSRAEKEICADPRLARLDRELARLFGLAVDGPNMSADRLKELKILQRGWIGARDDCGKAAEGLNNCIAASFAARIDDIRTGYFDARQDDGPGISSGPFVFECEGLGAALSATFVAADPDMVLLRWRDTWVIGKAVPFGSGISFEARQEGGTYEFQPAGEGARLTLPDGSALVCKQDEIG